MNAWIGNFSTGFVMAVILFLIIFSFALAAGISDFVLRKIEEKKTREYYAKFDKPIGKVTDYRVISNGYED